MRPRHALLAAAALWTSAVAGVDPLVAGVGTRDALRFAALLQDGAVPTAAILQRDYLDGAGHGVKVFTPGRIIDANHLATVVAKKADTYRYAIRTCLPLVPALQADLRAIYLAYGGLLPERPLPAVDVVFGALGSGGTADHDMQVIGLEVACAPGTTPAQFRTAMRHYFAHETVHTWQDEEAPPVLADPMLGNALLEGVADYLATLVTGEVPRPERDAWARQHEAWLWQEFLRDRRAVLADKASPRFHRWFGNCPNAPEGWPCEAGYWIGMRIAEGYVMHAVDKRAAIRELLALRDPSALLAASGYAGGR